MPRTFDEDRCTTIGQFVRSKRFLAGLRRDLLAPHWDDFVAWLVARGYGREFVQRTIRHTAPFAVYARAAGVREAADLSDGILERHLDARIRRGTLAAGRRRFARAYARRILVFLRERGILRAPPRPPPSVHEALLDSYCRFLLTHRGIGSATALRHRDVLAAFLEEICPDGGNETLAGLTADAIQGYVRGRAVHLNRSGRKVLCSAVRSFLRFLLLDGRLTHDLVSSVPVIPGWRLERVPRALPREDVGRILAAIDRSTPKGRRDYALLLLVATYGIRTGQVLALRLDDIDWRHETLRVRAAKGGRDVVLPLLPAVGEALVEYLRRGRPAWRCREIFLRTRAPMGPLSGRIYKIIEGPARRAGITSRHLGAHAWRHSCATQMLAQGQSLKAISDVLGHRSIETTFIYTKVDIERLRLCALEWPEAAS
ncbi:MAG: tyrosine-type recombinase/integrase [Armatimonadetes bacterium]|nr:tyrosine-type recombinase/integrase [Armatimonadota bacterium]